MAENTERCACSDPCCPVDHGSTACEQVSAGRLFRVDMEDATGTPMCEACTEDAMESALFTGFEELEDEGDQLDAWIEGAELPSLCPACGQHAAGELGRLGDLVHFTCRACGAHFNQAVGSVGVTS